MYRWMGSHFHDWIDYNKAEFSIEFSYYNGVAPGFLGVTQYFIFTVSKRTRMFVLSVKINVFFIQFKKWVDS